MLSRIAREIADEIRNHDWSDAPYRLDRAGHQREDDRGSRLSGQQLTPEETDFVRTNVMWVTGQVLGHLDPNFDEFEYAEWCGVDTRTPSGRPRSGHITAGYRHIPGTGLFDTPGGEETADEETFEDNRPDQVGTAEQRKRAWPPDTNTRGFITARGRNIHSSEQCPKYRHGIAIAKQRGRKIHPVQWTTTGSARAAEKGICSYCWNV